MCCGVTSVWFFDSRVTRGCFLCMILSHPIARTKNFSARFDRLCNATQLAATATTT